MSSVFDLDEPVDEAPVPAPRSRTRAAIATVALGLAAVTGWLVLREPASGEASRPVVVGEAQAVAIDGLVEVIEPTVANDAVSDEAEAGTVELCGIGRVRLTEPDERGMPVDPLADRTDDALRRTIARLAAQPDARSRAAALFVHAVSTRYQRWNEILARRTSDGVDCAKQPCADLDEPVEGTRARDALARLAVGSQDPWVYALAYQGCAKDPRLGTAAACQMISVERWTQIDPTNAVPWLYAADEARRRGDAAAVSEAFYRAAQAKTSDVRFGQLAAVLRTQEPPGLAPAVGLNLDAMALGIDAAVALPGYQQASQHCGNDALRDPNRRAVCDGLAEVLAERSTTMIDAAIGLSIAKRLGWPPARIEAIEEQRDALVALATVQPWHADDGTLRLDCEAVAEQREWVAQIGEHGEFAASRLRIAKSGRTPAQLAALQREANERSKQSAAVAAAASATAGARPAPGGILRTASPTP